MKRGELRRITHACLTRGERVICAGCLYYFPQAKQIIIDNDSGHYNPNINNLELVKLILDRNLEGEWNVITYDFLRHNLEEEFNL